MNHASLFSGIGGFDLAADWMGWNNMFHCEINPFCQKILKYYWPYAKTYKDIKTTNFSIWRGRIDILTGGFPCQPYSSAGKRLGKEDERHLWPEMFRAIREIKPRWIVGENVAGLLTWNDGLVFEELCADLENEGYEVQAFIIPACAVGAAHRRDRVWIIAYSDNIRFKKWAKNGQKNRTKINPRVDYSAKRFSCNWIAPQSSIKRLQGGAIEPYSKRKKESFEKQFAGFFQPNWNNFPTQPPICGGDDGLPPELDGITFPKWRIESIKGYGNAIVPQLVYEIFKAIENISK